MIAAFALAASACGNGDGGGNGGGGNGGRGTQFSEEFRTSFLQACESTSGGQTAYCQCALDHLEANVESETAITAEDQTAAATACQGELSD